MAHYAFLDENNIVTEVIVGKDETDTTHDWEQFYGEFRGQVCKRTSYNNRIRKNYAGIGYTYDAQRDAFIPPNPYPSWTLVEETCQWTAPVAEPVEEGKFYYWQESNQTWTEIDEETIQAFTAHLDAANP
jgi:hypothetical protein